MNNLNLTIITPEVSIDTPFYMRMYNILGIELVIEETQTTLFGKDYRVLLFQDSVMLHRKEYGSIKECQEAAIRLLKLYIKETE